MISSSVSSSNGLSRGVLCTEADREGEGEGDVEGEGEGEGEGERECFAEFSFPVVSERLPSLV